MTQLKASWECYIQVSISKVWHNLWSRRSTFYSPSWTFGRPASVFVTVHWHVLGAFFVFSTKTVKLLFQKLWLTDSSILTLYALFCTKRFVICNIYIDFYFRLDFLSLSVCFSKLRTCSICSTLILKHHN